MVWSTAVGEAGWIAGRLEPFGSGLVTSVVPAGFAAYARLLHPAGTSRDGHSRAVRWAEVAAWSGTPLEPDTQFHDIALPEREPAAPAPWDGQGPAEGTLTADDAAALAEILRTHTADPEHCWFCVWDGWGWDNAVLFTVSGDGRRDGSGTRLPGPVPTAVREGPRVRLPNRDYLLYAGPVEAALAFAGTQGQTPGLWWPADRTWCVASEIDLQWSYVGGPSALIEDLLADPRVETLPARPDGSHHFRVRGWLAAMIDDATVRLLEEGEVTIRTSRGTVRAELRRPDRWRRGLLRCARQGSNGVSAASDRPLRRTSEEELRREAELHLMLAVTGLVNG